MITLLYGSPGSGKTHHILQKMRNDAENGIRSFLIVPEQETVSAERRALTALPPSAQLSAEILNFSRLANLVFRTYGGLSYHYIDKGAKAFLMWKTVRELAPLFESFDPTAVKDPSLSEWLLGTVSDMKASCVSPTELERAAEALDTDDPLRKKLRDIALVSASFAGLVAESFDDSADDLTKLTELLRAHDFFCGTHVYIDSFTSYTAQELAVIREIARGADELTVSFAAPSPHSTDLHLASVIDTGNRIRQLIEGMDSRTVILKGNYRAKSESLALLSEYLWRLDLTEKELPVFPEDAKNSIRLLTAPSVYEEAENVAFRVLSLIRQGYRYRDIVVIARDASSLTGILDFAFDKYEIPYFLSEKEDLISLPPVKLLLSALRILSHGWLPLDVIAYLKTGLAYDVTVDIDLFEEYANTWKISGRGFTKNLPFDMNPDGYTDSVSPRGIAILDAANRVREAFVPPLLALSESLSSAKTTADEAHALRDFLDALSLREKLDALSSSALAAGRKQTADIYARLYETLLSILDKLAILSPEGSDEALDAEDIECAIRILLRTAEIGTIPTAVDEVTIGSANMLRASDVRCAILVGLCDGEFPAAIDESGAFSSAERVRLKSLGVELSPSYAFRSSDELLYVSRAVACPQELLILSTHSSATDGRSVRPSMPYLRAMRLLNRKPNELEFDSDTDPIDRILTPRLSLDAYPALKNSAAGEALRRLYRENGWFPGAVEASEIPVSDTTAAVTKNCAAEIFGDRMTLSQTRLEKYVSCRFGFYCSYVLALREKTSSEFGAGDSGNFLHRVLERFFGAAIGDSGVHSTFTREEIEIIADEVIEEYQAEILPSSLSLDENGRLPHLYRRLRDLSVMMIENILNEFAASEFVPRFFELKIGGSGAPKPLVFTLKDGTELTLPGVIDRVDLCRREDKLYIRIVDYKSGVKQFALSDLEDGFNTQMLIYLFTLCHATSFLKAESENGTLSPLPAGALYHSSALSAVPLDTYPDGDHPFDVRATAEKHFKRCGVLLKDESVLRAMNRDLDTTYLPGVSMKKKGGLSGSSLISSERFLEIEQEIQKTVSSVAEAMRSGAAEASPLSSHGKSPCTYCQMRPICRRNAKAYDTDSNEEDSTED